MVGAGPAGMAAALAVARAGIRPLVIDENARPGGQIHRQPPSALGLAPPLIPPLCRQFEDARDRMDILLETTAWGLFPSRRLAVSGSGRSQIIEAEHLILAPGAYEYVPPFAGWTLPGVMTPGAAQCLTKTMGVLPGRRTLVAGTGPFLLVVANQLHRAGMEVAGVIEMAPAGAALREWCGLLAEPGLLWHAAGYLLGLARAGIPIYRGHVLIEARGPGEVQEAVIAPCDADGRPDRDRARTVAVDTVCVGYGFIPRIQLAQLAGCRLRFEEPVGGWIPELGRDLRTSVPGIWSAGDGGGVAGALAAELEGALAGSAVCHELGAITPAAFARRRESILRRLGRLRIFRAALDRIYRLRPGLTDLARPDTQVCRCEELTRAEVEAGVDVGGTDARTLKVMTRLGMGPCQGQMCWPAAARLVAARTARSVESLGPLSARPPIVPIALGDLVELASAPAGEGAPGASAASAASGAAGASETREAQR
jgi:NADPH-dependent 2,4-dienoyl-CoA reductase/sulfur reductase-like enzyme